MGLLLKRAGLLLLLLFTGAVSYWLYLSYSGSAPDENSVGSVRDLKHYSVRGLLDDSSNIGTETRKLGDRSEEIGSLYISPNGKNYAEVIQVQDPNFKYPSSRFYLAPVAYALSIVAPTDFYVAVNGQRVSPLFDDVSEFAFAPDSSAFYYTVHESGKTHLIRNTKIIHKDAAGISDLKPLDSTAKRFAYVRYNGDNKRVIYDGRPIGPSFRFIGELHAVESKKTLAYVGTTEDDGRFLVRGGQVDERYDTVRDLFVTPDGSSVAFTIDAGEGVFSTGSGRYSKTHVVRDGHEYTQYDRVSKPMILPDGGLASIEERSSTQRLIINAVEGQWYGEVVGLVFSALGGHYAYKAYDCKGCTRAKGLVRDGELVKNHFDPPVNVNAYSLVFSSNGEHLAYSGTLRNTYPGPDGVVVVNDTQSQAYTRIVTDPIFIEDDTLIAYAALQDGEIWWVVDEVN